MFALTKKTDYAIIALCHMAQRPGKICGAREIAEQFSLPASLLMNIMKTLSRTEMVKSTRGAKGGYQLARPAEDVTLFDIITGVEGPFRFVQCAETAPADPCACGLVATCPVMKPVKRVHDQLQGFLSGITLAELAFNQEDDQAPDASERVCKTPADGEHSELAFSQNH